jgi:thiol-disulfide isomerase/thioredoxin
MKKLLLTILSVILIFNLQAQIVTGFNNITDTDGNTHSLNTYLNNGKFVVLNFYLLTCGNCMATAPKIESIYQSYGQNQCDVVVLSFNITDPATNSDCDNFATTYGNPSPPNFNYTEASWYQFYSAYGGSFAQTYVMTPNGNSVIYAHAGGVLNQPALESVLNNAIANSTSSSNIIACDSYMWPVNNQNYTASGTYSSLINSPGCPPYTETLNLTINSSTSNSTTQTACDSYTWSVDGNTYTTSGTYTDVSANASGCDHTEILNLIINNSTTSTDIQVHCDSYTWLDGVTYTASNNTATFTSTNAAGCDNVATLNLTINNSTSSSDTQVACDTYTWLDGVTYTASNNTTTFTSTNAAGCTEINSLYLTIIYSTSSYDTLSVGASIVWNGMPLNASGDYSVTLINSVGCDSITNLNLTITIPSAILNIRNTEETLFKITDMLGKETPYRRNTPLFYIYDDGTVEKRIVIE